MTEPSSRALVTRNRWFLARPAAPPLVSPRQLVLKQLRACSQLSARPHTRLSRGTAGPGWSCSFAAGLASPAGPEAASRLLATLGPVLTRACHAEPLAPGSSCSSAAGLASPAGPEAAWRLLATLGPSPHALVTRNRWLLARPAAPPLVFALARTPQSPRSYATSLARRSPPLIP
jgi:hypothetical protein